MIDLLDSHFNLLWEGRRTALPRHRTLRATIEWSYNLLSELERRVLCRLSVFLGDFTLEAARSVASAEEAGEAAIMAALGSLVAKSMLTLSTSTATARYRLLDTTRLYAQEKLGGGPDADVTARHHALYFLQLLERVNDSPSESLSAIGDQLSNIRGALTWCFSERGNQAMGAALAAAAMRLFFERSLLAECQLWATEAIKALNGANGNARHDLALHAALGSARMLTGQIDSTTAACLTRALALAETIGDSLSQLRLLDRLHLLQLFSGRLDDAMNTARLGAGHCRRQGRFRRAGTHESLSRHLLPFFGRSRRISSYIEAALLLHASEGDAHRSLTFDYPNRAEITLSRILWLQGYPDQAMADRTQRLVRSSYREAADKAVQSTALGIRCLLLES